MKEDTWKDKIQYAYWSILPYDWRPGQMWYRFKCFVWHRYTTIRPRYLGHTWCDRRCLVPEMMFEILSEFLEKECSPGHVEWYGEYPHMVTVDGVEKNVMDEMKDLAAWWHQVWHKERGETEEILWKEVRKHEPTSFCQPYTPTKDDPDFVYCGEQLYEYKLQFKTEEDDAVYHKCMDALNKLDAIMEKELAARLHRLVNVIPYMWT